MDFEKTLKQTVEEYALTAKKALGQNFLLDQNITDKIIRLSLLGQNLNDFNKHDVLEIGPGPGGLTRAILKARPKSLCVVEMDDRCVQIAEDIKKQTDIPLRILNADALEIDISALGLQNLQIVSNLPYNISVVLLTKWLKHLDHIEAMTLMFQKEVADRICAPIKTKQYGRLSVFVQLLCQTEKLWTLSPQCFVPAPKVHSCVLLFRPLQNRPSAEEFEAVERLTSAAFSQRRKMIRQSLKSVKNLEEVCGKIGVDLTARAEEISPEQYLELARLSVF